MAVRAEALVCQHALEVLVVFRREQLLELRRVARVAVLDDFLAVSLVLHQVDLALLRLCDDALQGLLDVVLGDLVDNTRAYIGLFESLLFAGRLLLLAILVVVDLLVDADLLAHDTLNVNLVRLVVVLDQGDLDGLLKALRVNGEVLIWNQPLDDRVVDDRLWLLLRQYR